LRQGEEEGEAPPRPVRGAAVEAVVVRPQPPVGALRGENCLDVALDRLDEGGGGDGYGERDDAVEPVGGALVQAPVGGAADPNGLRDVGPKAREGGGEGGGLLAELAEEPAVGFDCAEGEGGEFEGEEGGVDDVDGAVVVGDDGRELLFEPTLEGGGGGEKGSKGARDEAGGRLQHRRDALRGGEAKLDALPRGRNFRRGRYVAERAVDADVEEAVVAVAPRGQHRRQG
jgi:hypothetical protein